VLANKHRHGFHPQREPKGVFFVEDFFAIMFDPLLLFFKLYQTTKF